MSDSEEVVKYLEVKAALEKAVDRWEDPVMMAILLPFYELRDFKGVGKIDASGQVISGVLRMLGLIIQREDRRFQISPYGKAFVKWLIEGKMLTPSHGADFIIRYGNRFGRRIMYDAVFVPNISPGVTR